MSRRRPEMIAENKRRGKIKAGEDEAAGKVESEENLTSFGAG